MKYTNEEKLPISFAPEAPVTMVWQVMKLSGKSFKEAFKTIEKHIVLTKKDGVKLSFEEKYQYILNMEKKLNAWRDDPNGPKTFGETLEK